VNGFAAPAQTLVPDHLLTPPGGPAIAVFRGVRPEVVSLRLSFPLDEVGGEAGAGQFLQRQAMARMLPVADRIGARAEVHRTPQGLVYQVSGTIADLDFLGWILRTGVQAPDAARMEETRRVIQVENDRRMETPQGVLAALLRTDLAPETPSVFGTSGTVGRIDVMQLRAIWERSHRLDRARLVVAGRVTPELALALASELGLPSGVAPDYPPGSDPGTPRPEPQVNRHWIAEGYRLQAGEEVAALVAGQWLAEDVRAAEHDFEVGVEIWDLGGARALVLTSAAFPRSAGAQRTWLDGAFTDAAARITEADVSRVADAVRNQITMAARTPWGLAELVGQAWDAGNGPEGVETLLASLDSLGAAEVSRLFSTLAAATPVREELSP
jgi:predicted Zn-dependent peptidase